MAFGWPRGKNKPPMVFDQASAAMARGEIQIAARDGHKVPVTAGLGPDGEQTTDPAAVLKGVQLPFGGYKGAAIAMMVELMCAGLTGERFSFEAAEADNNDGGPPRGGEFIMAIDPAAFGHDEDWLAHSEGFFDRLLALEGTRLPGARRHNNRAKTPGQGIDIPRSLFETIAKLTGDRAP